MISTLLLCVVATELPIGFSRPASPMQQAIHQRQQGRFAEFYPGSQPAAASKPALAASGAAKAPEVAASSTGSTVASQSTIERSALPVEFVPGSSEQSYTPEATSSFENTLHSDSGLKVPVNVTVNNNDLAPQLASLNARLEELTRQLNEKSSADSERVFEYRIEESVATKETPATESATSTTPAAPAKSQVTKEVTVVTTSGSSFESLKSVPGVTTIPIAQATQPASATFAPAAPMASAIPVPQVIVVTQPVYPWAMPPGSLPPGSGDGPPPAMTSVPAESAPVTAQPALSKTTDSLADSSDRNARDSRDSNGVMNVFPLNLQMSVNFAPPANTEPAPKVAADAPQMPRQESASTTRKTAMTSQPPAELPALPIEQRPEPSAIRTSAPIPVAVASTSAAKAPAVAKQPKPSEQEDDAELFMPFEPVEETKPEVTVKASSTTKLSSNTAVSETTAVPETKAESRPVAAADSFDFETASASPVSEEPAPVLEPIRDSATVEPASASKASLPELFMPEPMNDDTNKVQPVAAEKEVPTPQPDPMFLTPSANSTLPPQALRAIPIPEEPSHVPAAEPTASTLTIPPHRITSPVVSTPAAPSTETVVIWESPVPQSPAPSSKGKKSRSRFSDMRDAFSEAGEEVRERFDSIPRPSFEAPNWMENLRGGSDASEASKPTTAPAAPPVHPNSVGPRRFHDSQNATGKPGQAMLQGSRANVAHRDSGRTHPAQQLNAQVARPAVSSQPKLSGPVRQNSPAGVPATAQNQPRRVMGHRGQTVSRSALPVPNLSVPRFDTPDWIEDPPVTLPSPPISQTAHRISSALRFAGQSKSVR